MAAPIYALPSDELAATVVPTRVQGTNDAQNPTSNLYDTLLDTVTRPGNTGVVEYQWDFVTPRTVGPVALLNLVADTGSAVKVYWTSVAWNGAPAGGETDTVTVLAPLADGRRVNYYVQPSGTKRYLRLLIPAQASLPAALGEIKVCSVLRQMTKAPGGPIEYRPRRLISEQRSDTDAVRIFSWGVTTWRMNVSRFVMTDAMKLQWDELLEGVKMMELPFLWIFDPGVTDPWYARFVGEPATTKNETGLWETSFTLEHVSPGKPIR